MTADLILHHYDGSPFSEKLRLILGRKNLPWKSVTVPRVMPKPDVVALTGGYRKAPVLQVGADIYCDTALICDVLEHVRPQPTLYPPQLKGVCRTLAQWADTTLFWAAMTYNLQGRGADHAFAHEGDEVVAAFAEDRRAMAVNMVRLRPPDATSALRSYLRRLAHMVEANDFLLGADPCVADFAAYHPLWFTRQMVPRLANILAPTPAVSAWMDRMAAFGHGTPTPLESAAAVAIAAVETPRPAGANLLRDSAFQDDHGIALGSAVTVAAESFGTELTEGALIAATRTHYSVRRTDSRAGVVHVHFPRIGYVLRAAQRG